MNPLIAYLKLIRLPNLLTIALTQYLMRWCIIRPLLATYGFELQMSEVEFFLLVFSTVLIAAAGYIINDYFDLRIDRINKPDKIIVGRHIKRRVAMGAHMVINIIGLAIGAYISFRVGMWKLVVLHVFAAMSLWFYSTNFKRQLFLGNFIIALLAGLIPLIVGLYEIPLNTKCCLEILREYQSMNPEIPMPGNFNFIAYWILAYSAFAFLLSLAREITKDIIDQKGDEATGCRTVPIVFGLQKTKFAIILIYAIIIAMLLYFQQTYLKDTITLVYMVVAICIPILFIIYKLFSSKQKKAFILASNLNKIVALLGILYALVANYLISS